MVSESICCVGERGWMNKNVQEYQWFTSGQGNSGYFTYRQFNIHKFHVLPTQCVYVFCVDLRTNSDYFPIQHWLTGFYNRDGVCLLHGTSLIFIYVIHIRFLLWQTKTLEILNINSDKDRTVSRQWHWKGLCPTGNGADKQLQLRRVE
jgi:hypothetical protein